MYTTLLTNLDKGILTVTINRADKMNALNKDVINDLRSVLTYIEGTSEVRAAILTGAGSKAFIAGADITEFQGLTREEGMALAKKGQDLFRDIEHCTKPFIAAVNGFSLGGGNELAMACHFRISSDNAKFGQPEVNLGLIPGYGGTQRLVQLIGKGRALELILSGTMIDAPTALQYGLVNYVVPQEELLPKANAILQNIISKAPIALTRCIRAVNAVFSAEDGYEMEVKAFGDCFVTDDMKEGTTAFLEKRKPVFKGS